MRPKPNTTTIVTPRGMNVGDNIKNDLMTKGIWSLINVDTINTVRDAVNRQLVTTVSYSFK